jgi:hypothetical protein
MIYKYLSIAQANSNPKKQNGSSSHKDVGTAPRDGKE